jgi:hypothetical protein
MTGTVNHLSEEVESETDNGSFDTSRLVGTDLRKGSSEGVSWSGRDAVYLAAHMPALFPEFSCVHC